MLEGVYTFFANKPIGLILRDLLDIFIVAYVVYRALLIIRGTRAMQMGLGLGVVFLVYLGAKYLHLVTLLNLLSALLSSIILIVVVVFQNDIRRALIRVGGRAWLPGRNQQETKVIDEVVAAATELARHRVGAIICFEQDANLLEFTKSEGVPIEAQVTRELLVALFFPEALNKLHDGAVLIRDLRIERAGVFFPMPETKILDASLGSRHRAALGITEETDAVVVVVSEERGTISFCFSGNIVSNLDGQSLRQALLGLFGRQPRKKGFSARVADLAAGRSAPPPPSAGRPSVTPTPAPPPVAPVTTSATKTPLIRLATPTPSMSTPMKGSKDAVDRHLTPKPRPVASAEATPVSTRADTSKRQDTPKERDAKDRGGARDPGGPKGRDGAHDKEVASEREVAARGRDEAAHDDAEERVRPSFVPTPSTPPPAGPRPPATSAAEPPAQDPPPDGEP